LSTRPRLFSNDYEHAPFPAVPIATADRQLLAAAAGQLELALTPSKRRTAGNPWDSKRLTDLAELLEGQQGAADPFQRRDRSALRGLAHSGTD
jgi:hypothetical protein